MKVFVITLINEYSGHNNKTISVTDTKDKAIAAVKNYISEDNSWTKCKKPKDSWFRMPNLFIVIKEETVK